MKALLLLATLLTGCTLNQGAHVDYHTIQVPNKIMYYCQYSDHWYSWNRTIAICETYQECNEKCAVLK